MKFDMNKLLHEIAADFGVTKDEHCKVGKCIVYLHTHSDGWKPLAYEDEALTVPYICDCEHEAFKDVAQFISELAVALSIADMLGAGETRMPTRQDFKLVAIELPEEAEITDTTEAESLLADIRRMQ